MSIEKKLLTEIDSLTEISQSVLIDSCQESIHNRDKNNYNKIVFASDALLIIDSLLHLKSLLDDEVIKINKIDSIKFSVLTKTINCLDLSYDQQIKFAKQNNKRERVEKIFQPILFESNKYKLNDQMNTSITLEKLKILNSKARLAISESALEQSFKLDETY